MDKSNKLKFYGKVIHVCETISGTSAKTGNKWAKQEFIMEELDVQRPQRIVFSIFGEERIKNLNIIKDQILEVSYSVSANDSGARWYGSNEAWKAVADPEQPQPKGTVILQQVTVGAQAAPSYQPTAQPSQQTPSFAPSQQASTFPPSLQPAFDPYDPYPTNADGHQIDPTTGVPF